MSTRPHLRESAAEMAALERRVDGPIAPATRRAVRVGGPEVLNRARAAASARCYDRLVRDSVAALAAARQAVATGLPVQAAAEILARQPRGLAGLRRRGLAARQRVQG